MHFFQHARVAGSLVSLAGIVALVSCRKVEPVAATTTQPTTATATSARAKPTAARDSKAAPAEPAKTSSSPAPEAVRKALGKWLRSDGGYVLELRKAEMSGVVEAAYFNPKSIHVSRAIWMQGGAGLQIMVELNDVGYPGATYVLTYDAQSDRLAGQYNQPAMGQTFDIDFIRQKP